MQGEIAKVLNSDSQINCYNGTFKFSYLKTENVDTCLATFLSLLGRGKEVIDENEKESFKQIFKTIAYQKEETFRSFKPDTEKKFHGMIIKLDIKLEGEVISVQAILTWAIVDLSKEWFWIRWKRENIIHIIDKVFKTTEKELDRLELAENAQVVQEED